MIHQFVGISLVVAGVTDVFTHIVFNRKVKLFKSGNYIPDTEPEKDTESEKETETEAKTEEKPEAKAEEEYAADPGPATEETSYEETETVDQLS